MRWLRPNERGDGVCLARLDDVVNAVLATRESYEVADLYGWRKVGDSEVVALHVMDAAGDAEHHPRMVPRAAARVPPTPESLPLTDPTDVEKAGVATGGRRRAAPRERS